MAQGWWDALLTARGGCLGVVLETMGLVGWLGWVVAAGAPPLAGTLGPSWNRGLESPLAVLGTELLGRKQDWSVCTGLGVWPRESGSWVCPAASKMG